MEQLAADVLDAIELVDPETRYEEKPYLDRGRLVSGTNEALRAALGAAPSEQTYPGSGQRCDLVLRTPMAYAWIEVKQSWTWSTYRNPAGANANRRKHLLEPGAQSALDDVQKLLSLLGHPGVDWVGLLVVTLDSDPLPYPVSDIAQLEMAAGIATPPWRRFDRPRRPSRVPGYELIRMQPYLWLRPAR